MPNLRKAPKKYTRAEVKRLPPGTSILRLQRVNGRPFLMRGWRTFDFDLEYCTKGGKTTLKGVKPTNAGYEYIWIYKPPSGAPLKFPVERIYEVGSVRSYSFDELYNPEKYRAEREMNRLKISGILTGTGG